MRLFFKGDIMDTDKLLEILISSGDYVSGQALAQQLGVSRQAVWKGVGALRDNGCEIASVTNRGYMLKSLPQTLSEAAVRASLNTGLLGKNLIVLDSVDSTNNVLKRMGAEGCPSGTTVAAREQTCGKGRLGRKWESTRDDNLYFSLLLRPTFAPAEASAVTPLAGLAVCKALREFTGLDCRIKWPNDIIVGKKKLVGILTEMSAEFDRVEYIVTGIGINVDQALFPENIAYKATSLLLETGRHYNKNKLLAAVLKKLEEEFSESGMKLDSRVLDEYGDLCATVGRSVTFTRGTRRISGIAVGVDRGGSLKVMLSDGSLCLVSAGEVTVQGIY